MTDENSVLGVEVPFWQKRPDELTTDEKSRWRPQSAKNQAALQEIVKEHQLWLRTDGKEGAPLNLSHDDLSGAVLDATIFNGARARGLQLVRAELPSANLYQANIENARISSESLADAVLVGASEGTFTARVNRARAKLELPNWEWDPRDR